MSVEEIKALERRFAEEWNKGKAAAMNAIDELYATDFVEHTSTGDDTLSLKDYKQSMSELYSAFPDIHFTLDDMVVEGDKVAVRFTFSGTHKGEFEGIPPTNKKVTMWGIYIDRLAGGKFVESWVRYDTLGLNQQLGPAPKPGQG
ncbi:MAG: ester cyclase [Aigarchaeota archaeon]|nr:ester cyclase [Aigarchaeota archaeon]